MSSKFIKDGNEISMYYHKTDGGAEYLTDKFIECPDGSKEGTFKDANLIIRIDAGEPEIERNML